MQRHSRAEVRLQRDRYKQRRLRQFAHWLGYIDYGTLDEQGQRIAWRTWAPRPLEVRAAEFWTGRRVGMLSKWNGTCQHCSRNRRVYRNRRERLDRILLLEIREDQQEAPGLTA